jgi:hypothetical protein
MTGNGSPLDGIGRFSIVSLSFRICAKANVGLMRAAPTCFVKIPAQPSSELRISGAAAQTRIVPEAGIWRDSRKSVRPCKGIICGDISEFESDMPSHAVRSLSTGSSPLNWKGPVERRPLLFVLSQEGNEEPMTSRSIRHCALPRRAMSVPRTTSRVRSR